MYKNEKERCIYEFLTGQCPTPKETRAVFQKYIADDCVWENTGFPPAAGRAQISGLLDGLFAGGFYALDQTVTHLLSSENIVVAERYEKMLRIDGSVICEFKIVGVFEFGADGLVHFWRDYFDSSVAQKAFGGG